MSSPLSEELNEEAVKQHLMVLLLPPSQVTRYSNNNERNRGGEKENHGGYVSERTMDIMLRDMRKMDRDRDRVLHPTQVKTLFAKYKVTIIVHTLFYPSPLDHHLLK